MASAGTFTCSRRRAAPPSNAARLISPAMAKRFMRQLPLPSSYSGRRSSGCAAPDQGGALVSLAPADSSTGFPCGVWRYARRAGRCTGCRKAPSGRCHHPGEDRNARIRLPRHYQEFGSRDHAQSLEPHAYARWFKRRCGCLCCSRSNANCNWDDGGGSIRNPCSLTGLVGIKPNFARVPVWPAGVNPMLLHVGPIARSVDDAALVLSVIAGRDRVIRIHSLSRSAASWMLRQSGHCVSRFRLSSVTGKSMLQFHRSLPRRYKSFSRFSHHWKPLQRSFRTRQRFIVLCSSPGSADVSVISLLRHLSLLIHLYSPRLGASEK